MLTRTQQEQLLQSFRALADENRLTMVGLLHQGERRVSDLATQLDISEPTTSHHLSKLRLAGLVNLRTEGNQHFYFLNRANVEKFKNLVADIENLDLSRPPAEDFSWLDALNLSPEDRKIFEDYTAEGRLTRIPVKQKKLLVILRWLATRFQSDIKYTEKEVNTIISQVHADFATLRRELVDFGFLRRERGGGKYWLTPEEELA